VQLFDDVLLEQADLVSRAVSKAQEVGGTVRLISRCEGVLDTAESNAVLQDLDNIAPASVGESMSGFVQV